jgi:hypothetical protein
LSCFLYRSMILRTPPGSRTPTVPGRSRARFPLRQRRSKYPARVPTPVPPGKSRMHHRNACGACAVGAAGLETSGSDEAWSWVGGLIEGEGYFQPGLTNKKRGVQVAVDSTDEDVVERLAALTVAGTVINLGSRQAHWKTRYRWSVTKKADVESVLSGIVPTLGARRARQASYVLEHI